MTPSSYVFILAVTAVGLFLVYPTSSTSDEALVNRIADAIAHRRSLEPPADLAHFFDGPAPWPLAVSKIVGALAERGLLAHEVERDNLPDNVPNIRGPAAYFSVESPTPFYAVLTTGMPQLTYYD